MRRYNRTSLKIYGLKAKTYATVLILLELILITSLVGFTYKQHIKIAQAEGVYSTIYQARHTLIENPTSQQQQIINYIKEVFGSQSDNAFKVLSCENHRLNPNAQNWNSDGSIDTGIFQVNSIHGVNANYLKDWRVNVDVAHQIYLGSSWNAWTCAKYYHVLEK